MGVWQGAWYLAKHEMRKNRWGVLITLVAITYSLLFLVPMLEESLKEDHSGGVIWAVDFLFLMMLPCFGMLSSQMMTAYWRTDPYTKKLALWRTLPISLRQIALGKLIQLTITLLAAQTLFFILYYVAIQLAHVEINTVSFILHAVFWFGFSLASSIVYTYLEMGYTGKVYSIIYFIIMLMMIAGTLLFTILNGRSIVIMTLNAFDNGNWWLAVIAIVIGIAAIPVGMKAMEKRLQRRHYVS